MSAPRFKPIWNIISIYGLNLPEDSLNDDLRCVICKKIMRDACASSSCGCQYCYDCIHEYNNVEEKYCPGDKQDCKDQHILFGINVNRSEILNKRISRLKVQCPNESCRSYIELMQMEEHLRVCKKLSIECPFVAIGCISKPINRETLESHLHCDNETHTQLLIELIQNLKNEVNEMKEEFAKSKLDSMDKDNRIAGLEEQLNREKEMRVNIEIQRTEEIGELRRQLEERDAMVTDLRKDVDDVFGESKLEMTSLKEESRNKEERMEEELTMVRIIVTDLRKDVDGMMEWRKKCDEEREGRLDKCDKLCLNIVGDFRWQIDQLSTKIDTSLYSESFYSNNYKLCLYLRIWSDDNIYLYCYIMKGDNDDMVEWPMRQVVTLSIVDQVTMTAYKTEMYNYDNYKYKSAFDRPTKDMNDCGIGSYIIGSSFIKYSLIKSKPSIIVKDSIVVSCAVSDH